MAEQHGRALQSPFPWRDLDTRRQRRSAKIARQGNSQHRRRIPKTILSELRAQLASLKDLHQQDLERNYLI